MVRDSGLHAALAMAVLTVIGAILEHIAIGVALGLLAAAVVTWRWPAREAVHVDAEDHPTGDDRPAR
jgi:hypothetical protein